MVSHLARGRLLPFFPMSTATTSERLDTSTQVDTPEHVSFEYALAGPAVRGLAWMIDTVVRVGIVVGVVLVAAVAEFGGIDAIEGASTGVMLVLLFVLEWGYFALFEAAWSGRTPGKKAMRIRVVRENGHGITIGDAFLRNLLRAADWLPGVYAIGLLVMGGDRRFRRLGDLAAGTMVVSEDTRAMLRPITLEPPPTREELAWLPEGVDVSKRELDAIELLLRRRGLISPARELELADLLAPVLARRFGVRYHDPARFLALVWFRGRGGLR